MYQKSSIFFKTKILRYIKIAKVIKAENDTIMAKERFNIKSPDYV
jgi:hypothetical protein